MRLDINGFKTISIFSKQCWNETGVEIQSGEEYRFEAVGSWKDMYKKCDADGYTRFYMSLYNRWKRSPENKWFALMGSIDQNKDFLIGKTNQRVFSESGKLYCYANDIRGFYWNNSGEVSLTVIRMR